MFHRLGRRPARTTPTSSAAPEIVAIDGKTSRRTHDRSKDRGPLHLVSAWASSRRLVLGQQACEAKSNEITANSLLLERLVLTGALVTIDAMGTQTKIAKAILDRGGDYLLALKNNQASLHDEIRRYLDDPAAKIHSLFDTSDGDHGRIEVRRHLVSHDLDWLTTHRRFPGEPRSRACAPSPWLRRRSSETAAPAWNGATTSPLYRSTPNCSHMLCASLKVSENQPRGIPLTSKSCSGNQHERASSDSPAKDST